MKNLQLTLAVLALLFATFSFNSCTPDEELIEFALTIDGEAYDFRTLENTYTSTDSTERFEIMANGSLFSGLFFIISMTNLEVGTYTMSPQNGDEVAMQYSKGLLFPYNDISGELVISSHDRETNKISGTFDGTLEDIDGTIVEATNGIFNLEYTE